MGKIIRHYNVYVVNSSKIKLIINRLDMLPNKWKISLVRGPIGLGIWSSSEIAT